MNGSSHSVLARHPALQSPRCHCLPSHPPPQSEVPYASDVVNVLVFQAPGAAAAGTSGGPLEEATSLLQAGGGTLVVFCVSHVTSRSGRRSTARKEKGASGELAAASLSGMEVTPAHKAEIIALTDMKGEFEVTWDALVRW